MSIVFDIFLKWNRISQTLSFPDLPKLSKFKCPAWCTKDGRNDCFKIEASPQALQPCMHIGNVSKLAFLLPSETLEQHICL